MTLHKTILLVGCLAALTGCRSESTTTTADASVQQDVAQPAQLEVRLHFTSFQKSASGAT